MLTTLAAAIWLAQVPTSTSSHLDIQKFKWEQSRKLDNVRLDFTVSMGGSEGESTSVWKLWQSGKVSNFEAVTDGQVQLQLSMDQTNSYLVDHVNKNYYLTPVLEPSSDPKVFALPESGADQIEFKFEGLWFYINAAQKLDVTSVKEEKVDGRSFVVASYEAKSENGVANVSEWIEPKTGLVHRFSIRIRSEDGLQAIDGWMSHLELDYKASFLDRMFVPSAHPDYTKVDN